MPLSKVLLKDAQSTMMAAFLYLGAGIGIGLLVLCTKQYRQNNLLQKKDLPYTLGMIGLDIAAPILLMAELVSASAANASLLNNFEIVAISLIALALFHEKISGRLWAGILLITLSSILLSLEGTSSFQMSTGSLLDLAATCCWGLENNCTRAISNRNTYEVVMIKGLFSGGGSLLIALAIGEHFPPLKTILKILLLGFVAYGLSIFFYI